MSKLLYPHEDITRFQEATVITQGEVFVDALKALGHAPVQFYGGFIPGSGRITDASRRAEFVQYNGHDQGAELLDKSRYPAIIDAIGYLAPRTVLIGRQQKKDAGAAREALAAIEAQDTASPRRFLKPLRGCQARGTMFAADPEEALYRAQRALFPYLVQNVLVAKQEYRYALHRDSEQVSLDGPHCWRIAFAKERASVTGDGVTPLYKLAWSNPNMPHSNFLKFIVDGRSDVKRVPEAGEHVELAVAGNTGGRLLNAAELAVLDPFMTTFAARLEEYLGAPLATICMDMGCDPETLKQVYDEERLQREVVLYEYQVPFSAKEYYRNIPALQELRGMRARKEYRLWEQALLTSFYASGRMYQCGRGAA